MADTAIVGHVLKFGVGAIGAAAPATTRLAFESCTLSKVPGLIEPEAQMRGTVARDSESVSQAPYTVGGSCVLTPRPDELAVLIPLILGNSWTVGAMLPALITDGFVAQVDRSRYVHTYGGLKVTRAVFQSAAGQQLKLTMDMEGLTETEGAAGSFPSLTLSTQAPMTHSMAVLTINSNTHYTEQVQVVIENTVLPNRFFNTAGRTEVPVVDRIVRLSCSVPYTANAITDLYKVPITGRAASVVWTNGGLSLTFEFPCLQASPRNADAQGKQGELMLPCEFIARTLSGDPITQEIKATLDYTP